MSRLVALTFHDVFEQSPAESGFSGEAADRYKLSRGQFEAQLAGLRGARRDPAVLLTGVTGPATGGAPSPFAITVDDGGCSYHTIVADRLEALGWRGHCFVATDWIGRPGFLDAGQLRELRARGHVIGSHSASHPRRLSGCPWPGIVREWSESRRILSDILGEDVTVASVPGGYFSPAVARAAREAGLRVLFTSEPQTRIGRLGDCVVVGRFTIRPGHRPERAGQIAARQPAVRWREWVEWNAKKLLKACLGDAYIQISHARARVGRGLSRVGGAR